MYLNLIKKTNLEELLKHIQVDSRVLVILQFSTKLGYQLIVMVYTTNLIRKLPVPVGAQNGSILNLYINKHKYVMKHSKNNQK